MLEDIDKDAFYASWYNKTNLDANFLIQHFDREDLFCHYCYHRFVEITSSWHKNIYTLYGRCIFCKNTTEIKKLRKIK